jgi:hypothetical protein
MNSVRHFVKGDIPQVVDLFQRVFFNNGQPAPSSSKLKSYFEEVFFHNPWVEEDLASLVYETSGREIIGFIGVTPRRMYWREQPIRVAVSMHFMVEPGSRSTLAGVQLLKTFFSGPQDLSLTDSGSSVGRKVWEGLGGTTALAYSINWMRLLRPSQYLLYLLARKNQAFKLLSHMLRPLCPMMDALASRVMSHRFGRPSSSLREADLDQGTVLASISRFSVNDALRPDYDQISLSWLFDKVDQLTRPGGLQKALLYDAKGELAGWYLYTLDPDGIGEVLQVVGSKKSFSEILDHLFQHGWKKGAMAFTGRLNPKFAQEYSDKQCFLGCGSPWMLVHSRNPELLQAIYQGNVFLTRLEGEWCMRFVNG